MGKFYTLFLFIVSYINCLAQKEAGNWYFGQLAGVSFNSGAPVALTNGQISTFEGCASISDANGNLLFYTDGTVVRNKNHTIMTNGNNLKGNSISSQSAIIIPKPGSNTNYYIFTTDFQGGLYGPSGAYPDGNYDGLRYSEVDISLSAGLGAVIASNKNTILEDSTTEGLSAVRHSNGIDFWVVTHDIRNNHYLSYLITSTSVNLTPVISASGPNVFVNEINYGKGANGIIKISPDGRKIAATHFGYQDLFGIFTNKDLVISDFNTSTGIVSNSLTIPVTTTVKSDGPYGIEFSNCSEYLYATESAVDTLGLRAWPIEARIWRFDLNASDVAASQSLFRYSTAEYFGSLQLSLDGKIYCARIPRFGGSTATYIFHPSGGNSLHAINNPRLPTATFTANAINLSGRYSQLGLPPYISTYFYTSSITATNIATGDTALFCVGDSVIFRGTTSAFDSIRWYFNDTASGIQNTSASLNPRHLFSNGGTYQISLLKYLCGNADTARKNITITNFPVINNLEDITVCEGTSVLINGTSSPATSYLWNTGAITPTITSDSTGRYVVTVSNNGCISKDSMFLRQIITATAAVTISSDASNDICAGTAVQFTANPDLSLPTNGIRYQWYKNGILLNDTTEIFSTNQINNADTFAVLLTVSTANTCLLGDSTATNIFPVTVKPVPVMEPIPNQILCVGENSGAVAFNSNLIATNFNWTNSDTTIGLAASGSGTIPSFVASNDGVFSLTGTITITPVTDGCNGSTQQFSYTVNECLLPVELIVFDGRKTDDFVNYLFWNTASEYNSNYFSLEHSLDIENFSEIYRTSAAGNSNQVRNYNYLHENVPQGINYYRLKLVDLDGSFTYSEIVQIVNKNEQYTAAVYPNPATDNITILINNPQGNSQITIFDAIGQLMHNELVNEQKNVLLDVNISHFANGMYFISISDNRNKITIPVLKQ